jgi:REP element-mobilizing transposase RayT
MIFCKLNLYVMKQLEFSGISGWGGRRRGAGRPNLLGQVGHEKRARVQAKFPLHITMRVKEGIPPLRTRHILREFKKAIQAARAFGLFINHFVLLDNHFHLIAEASSNEALTRAMKSLGSRFAKAIRKASDHNASGVGLSDCTRPQSSVFESRYHLHVLKTPREVRNALQYVLLNKPKHEGMLEYIDWFSSGFDFQSWRELIRPGPMIEAQLQERGLFESQGQAQVQAREGWMKAGRFMLDT